SAVALVTGHENPEKEESAIDWPALAGFPGTLVFYMGVRRLPAIAQSLIAAGRDPSEPAAIVERGTLPGQRAVHGTLATIARRAAQEQVRAPSVTIVGAVTGLREQLAWLARSPLAGLTVAVTRARTGASSLAARLEELGARVVQAPVIATRSLAGPAPELSRYDLVCLTSPTGVENLFARLAAAGRDARALAASRVAAIGPGTAQALAAHGIAADVVPERSVAEGLVEALAGLQPKPRRALIARAKEGREVLPQALREMGAEVELLALYETFPQTPPAPVLEAALAADYVTFTSASTVRFFLAAAEVVGEASSPLSAKTRIVSIGPITSEALREQGLEPHVQAARHDIDGLLEALLADVAAAGDS
ncbi:MAG TPA: uroporphyrinogen-III synthase, partial [Solirubrobacteraceae bacterium]|nr:uroporphyrinogen-III synthase [Solirubrobacteraceae bacterium]